MDTFLSSSSLQGLSSMILFPLFATGGNDTGSKFAAACEYLGEFSKKL
jgi:hypothetical protein